MMDSSLLLTKAPPGWMPTTLGGICDVVKDPTKPTADGDRIYIGLEHLASGLPKFVDKGHEGDVRSAKTSFRKHDVLFGKLRPYLRKSVLAEEEGICSTDILVLRAKGG